MILDAAARLPRWSFPVIFAALGCLSAAGLQPLGLWFVTLIALGAALALFAQARGPWQGAFWLWSFGTGYFVTGLRWILEPFQVEADIFGWMAPFALALMAAGLALFWGAAGWSAIRFGAGRRGIWLVLTLCLAEFARAYLFTGFPWAGLAQIWVDTPISGALSVAGPHGVALLTLLASFGIAALAGRDWRGAALGAGAALLLAGLAVRLAPVPADANTARPVIRIVQPNAPQHEKFDPDKWRDFFWRQVEATEAAGDPDLIVWPETAIPMLLNNAHEALDIVAGAAGGTDVVLGIQRMDPQKRFYNALIVVAADGTVSDIYNKHHLVPFGEYMPFPALFRNLGIRGLAERADGGYSAGPGPRMITASGLRALPLICYEAVFPQYGRAAEGRPDLLLQITNDAWFGTYAGPQQHLAQARMRAIEQGLPLVRSANTGISAMIGPTGQVLASLPLGTHGFVDAPLPAPLPPTFYARTGDWVAFFVLMAGFFLVNAAPGLARKGKSH
ncbi:apolipoprotein N-acyltransferase [Aliishimia ponticola]|uniref:Apolipoprotein N-acyltransferase n=1 Tax=Aliishimia ponticola TaxID=2499833 RepID=A0A4S4NG84_9RHOB|nr:apolipoprotein N-acyltransferase [Aliishimia ponticola]THH37148.1 apolipoprotein N-acyltransferase [Aliishimia ponticola]